MAVLVIDGLTVKATEFRALPDERGGGGNRRTINGDLRGRSDWVRRAWAGTVYAADATELAAVKLACDPDAEVAVSGDAIGSSVTVRAAITGDTPYVRTKDGWYHLVPVSLREA
jgi:hypothetical protein